MRAALTALGLCVALALVATPSGAQDGGDPSARQRWEQKTPEERAVLRERFAELKEMSEEERHALEGLAERLKAREREISESLPEELRARLAKLPPDARRGVVHEHFRDVLRREGEDVLERLPKSVVRELEAVPPQRRPLRLEKILRQERPLGPRDVRRIGEAFGVPPERLAGLEQLQPAELEDRALAFHREQIGRRVRELGPPPGIDAEAYAELAQLSHHEFFRHWRALDPTEAYGAPSGRDAGPPRGPGGPWPGPPPGAELSEAARARADLFANARRMLAPTLEERLELAGADPDSRRRALGERGRRRCLAFLEEHQLLSPAELEALRAKEGRAFEDQAHHALRRAMHEALGGGRRDREPGPGGAHPGGERRERERRFER